MPGMHMRLGNPLQIFDPPRHPHGHGHGCSSAPLRDLNSYRCHHPSYYAGAWTDQHQQGGGGGEGGPHSTRAVLAVSAPRPHLYISALLPRPHDAISFFLSSGFLSINSRLLLAIKTTVIISFYFLLSRSLKSLAILASAYHSLPTLVLY